MTKFRGVAKHKDGGFTAAIGISGRKKYLGYFADFDSAKAARISAEVMHFGAEFDRREIEVDGSVAKIPLHGWRGVFKGWATVDLEDLDSVRGASWTIDPRGYVVGRVAGHGRTTLHRFLLPDAKTIDHRNGDRLDNRRANLRSCVPAENSRNTRIAKSNTSGAKGVTKTSSGKWRARIWVNWREIHLGTFRTKEEASLAYDRAAIEKHGEFASPNAQIVRLTAEKRYGEQPGASISVILPTIAA